MEAMVKTICSEPFMPESMEKLFVQIGAAAEMQTWDSAAVWGTLSDTAAVTKGENLFPRIDMEKALAELEAAAEAAKKAALPALEIEPYAAENVDFDTFCKSDFRAVKVKACENVKKSEKLLKFTLGLIRTRNTNARATISATPLPPPSSIKQAVHTPFPRTAKRSTLRTAA